MKNKLIICELKCNMRYIIKTNFIQKETLTGLYIDGVKYMPNYNEKAVVVWGNTKPYRNVFKELDGSFNTYLRSPNNDDLKIVGWVFPKCQAKQIDLENILKSGMHNGDKFEPMKDYVVEAKYVTLGKYLSLKDW